MLALVGLFVVHDDGVVRVGGPQSRMERAGVGLEVGDSSCWPATLLGRKNIICRRGKADWVSCLVSVWVLLLQEGRRVGGSDEPWSVRGQGTYAGTERSAAERMQIADEVKKSKYPRTLEEIFLPTLLFADLSA